MPELTQKFTPDRSLVATTPGAPSTAGGFMQGLDPNLIARLIEAKRARNAPAPPSYAEAPAPRASTRRRPVPRLRSSEPFMEAAPRPRTRAEMKDPSMIPRFSYAFNPLSQAGTAPVLPTQVGWGRQGVDFILEGGPQDLSGLGAYGGRPEKQLPRDPRMESQKQTSMTDAELESRRQPRKSGF